MLVPHHRVAGGQRAESTSARLGRSHQAAREGLSAMRLLLAATVAVMADSVGAPSGELLPVVFDVGVAVVLTLIVGPRAAICSQVGWLPLRTWPTRQGIKADEERQHVECHRVRCV